MYDLWDKDASKAPKPSHPYAQKHERRPHTHHKRSMFSRTTEPVLRKKIQTTGIVVAHKGDSYNPREEHRQEALRDALQVAEDKQKAQDELTRKSRKAKEFKRQLIQQNKLNKDWIPDEQQEKDEETRGLVKPVKAEDRLTRVQKNRKKRLQRERMELQQRREEKKKIKQINQ